MRIAPGLALLFAACGRVGFDAGALDGGADGAGPGDAPVPPDADCQLAFGPPTLVAELAGLGARGPSLSADGLAIYFGADGDGVDIWSATRTSRSGAFTGAGPVLGASGTDNETDPAIAPDDLELFFSRGTCIQRLVRDDRAAPWAAAPAVGATCTDNGQGATNPTVTALYFTIVDPLPRIAVVRRPDRASDFTDRRELALDGPAGFPFVSADERTLLFERDLGGNDYELFLATRADATAAFGPATALADVNTMAVEEDAHLTADGQELYFSSNRGAGFDLYRSAVTCRAAP